MLQNNNHNRKSGWSKKAQTLSLLSSVALVAISGSAPAFAQPDDGSVDEIITLGTRAVGRTTLDSSVPVDVVTEDEILSTGATETGRVLQALAPSFNFSSSSISDGTDSLRPATLRGLGPDQTLVLINGKRRHSSALIHVNTSVGRGTAGTDINAIPPSAIGRIEVLRDGAAAQYGSDAIAGVINFNLKTADEGGTLSTSYGETYEGDGETFVASINKGFAIGDKGFVNVTYEYRDRASTNRAGRSAAQQYPFANEGAATCTTGDMTGCLFDPREFTFDRQNFRIGDGDSEQHVFFVNSAVTMSDNAEAYMFGSYSNRQNETGGFYRRANQFDRTVLELYPDGFLPLIQPTVIDLSGVAGIDWTFGDWTVDTSIGFGTNSYEFTISNSANASLGAASPTSANAGTLRLSQLQGNIDIVRSFDMGGRSSTFAFGAEARSETYKIEAGEPASYIDGGALNTNCFGCSVPGSEVTYSPGFQVFRGWSPSEEVDEARESFAFYAELETDVTDSFTLSGALRFEDYSDFGETLTGKIAGRWAMTDDYAIRGAVSTGFRAPSMQQQFFNSVSTQFVTVGMTTVAQERGTFRNDSPAAAALGIPAIKEETSLNYSVGFVATPTPDLTFTVDLYKVDIDDRIVITRAYTASDTAAIAAALTSVGATAAQFFTNAVDTETQGVDFIGSYDVPHDIAGGQLKLSAAANYTETEIAKDLPSPGLLTGLTLLSAQDRSIIEEWQPKSRVNLTADWSNGPLSFLIRGSRYGEYTTCEGSCNSAANVQTFSAKWLTDIQASFEFEEAQTIITIGANNVFDEVPDTNLIGQSRGGTLTEPGTGTTILTSPGVFEFSRRAAPFGFNGGYYYARITKNF